MDSGYAAASMMTTEAAVPNPVRMTVLRNPQYTSPSSKTSSYDLVVNGRGISDALLRYGLSPRENDIARRFANG